MSYSSIIRESRTSARASSTRRARALRVGLDADAHRLAALVHPRLPAHARGEIEDGDVIVHNHPYLGASHSPDVAVAVPIFHEGELLGFAAVTAHVLDVGGSFPGHQRRRVRRLRRGEALQRPALVPARRAERGPRPDDLRQRPHRDDEPRRHERDARRVPARPRPLPPARRALRRRRRDERGYDWMDYSERMLRARSRRSRTATTRRSSAGSTTTRATAACGCGSRRR
jgi:hypothetical protein